MRYITSFPSWASTLACSILTTNRVPVSDFGANKRHLNTTFCCQGSVVEFGIVTRSNCSRPSHAIDESHCQSVSSRQAVRTRTGPADFYTLLRKLLVCIIATRSLLSFRVPYHEDDAKHDADRQHHREKENPDKNVSSRRKNSIFCNKPENECSAHVCTRKQQTTNQQADNSRNGYKNSLQRSRPPPRCLVGYVAVWRRLPAYVQDAVLRIKHATI